MEFTGLDCPGQGKLAVLQYRGGSLEAVKLRLAKKDLKLKAEGEVIVADRQGIRRGSIAEIDLHPEAPIAVILK